MQSTKHVLADLMRSDAFADMLAAIDAEENEASRLDDPIATPRPTQVFEGEKINLSNLGYPAGEVIGIRTTYRQESDAKEATHEIHLYWTDAGDDEMVITTHVERLVRALRELLWPTLGRIVLPTVKSGPIEVVSEDYYALQPKVNKTGFVKGSWTVVLVPTYTV